MPRQTKTSPLIDGITLCSRYAFGPNRLHLCGPDANTEILAYLKEGASDAGLSAMLEKFANLHPYLETIAHANRIRDPFDAHVVEAYWIGNELLENIPAKIYYRHLVERVGMKRKQPTSTVRLVEDKLRLGAPMHHTFHVLNLFRRADIHALDQCRTSWGTITSIDGPIVVLQRRPLEIRGTVFALGPTKEHRVKRQLADNDIFAEAKVGDVVSLHWNVVAEILSPRQVVNLSRYTDISIRLANLSLQ